MQSKYLIECSRWLLDQTLLLSVSKNPESYLKVFKQKKKAGRNTSSLFYKLGMAPEFFSYITFFEFSELNCCPKVSSHHCGGLFFERKCSLWWFFFFFLSSKKKKKKSHKWRSSFSISGIWCFSSWGEARGAKRGEGRPSVRGDRRELHRRTAVWFSRTITLSKILRNESSESTRKWQLEKLLTARRRWVFFVFFLSTREFCPATSGKKIDVPLPSACQVPECSCCFFSREIF